MNGTLTVLELFSGTECISNAFRDHGHECLTLDYESKFNPTFCMDIRNFVPSLLNGKKIDVLWASPDCTTFSVASLPYYWIKQGDFSFPKNRRSLFGIENVMIILDLIKEIRPKCWFMENPVGMMRTLPILRDIERKHVTYCSYGDVRMKPTDIWTNCTSFDPREPCHNGNLYCHHERAPAGSKFGTQGLKDSVERSKIPSDLCKEIVMASQNYIKGGGGIFGYTERILCAKRPFHRRIGG